MLGQCKLSVVFVFSEVSVFIRAS